MLNANLELLRSRFPRVASAIEGANIEGTEFAAARNGRLTAKVTDAARGPQMLYSGVEPERAARRDVERWSPAGGGGIVALGAGLGYHVFALAERFPDRPLAAAEARADLILKSMETFDWTPLLKRNDFILLGPGDVVSALPAAFRDPRPDVFTHPVLFKLDMPFYYPFWRELTAEASVPGRLRVLSFACNGDVAPYSLTDIQETLRDMGHDVRVADLRGITREREFTDAVRNAAVEYCPDIVVTVGAVGVCDDVLGRLGVPVAAWFMDNPFGQLAFSAGEDGPRAELLGDTFFAFSWDEYYVPLLMERGVRAHYLPLATNPKVHYPRAATPEEQERYGADISFVGTADRGDDRDYRFVHVRELAGLDVALWGGQGWRLLGDRNFRYRGRADNRAEAPLIYSSSKINLNLTAPQLVTALPIRIFDSLACEGFVLTDRREDLSRLFGPDEGFAIFESKAELREMAEHYLSHPEERAATARRGREAVLARHTYRHRLETMLGIVFNDKE